MKENGTKELIYEHLKAITKQIDFNALSQFTTIKICEDLAMSRTLVSQTLNELSTNQLLVKVKSRPVYFFSKENLERQYHIKFNELEFLSVEQLQTYLGEITGTASEFGSVIGSAGSLSYAISRIKSALIYPTALPILLYAGKGSGKSYLVKQMYEFCVNHKLFKKDARFLTYRVSRHTSLVQHEKDLFGYYDSTKKVYVKGLLEECEGGLLYICNVESLDLSIQERLADFLSSRQLFRNRESKKIDIKIVISDTENPDTNLSNSLLATLPVICKLPTWTERSEDERREFVACFLEEQRKTLNCQIMISRNLLNFLVKYDYTHNIDELKKIIVSLCANAYAESDKSNLKICMNHLPVSYLQGNFFDYKNDTFLSIEEFRSHFLCSRILNVYQELVEIYLENSSIDGFLKQGQKTIRSYYDVIDFESDYTDSRIPAYEALIGSLFEQVKKDKSIHIPLNCARTIARMIVLEQNNSGAIRLWEKEQYRTIEEMRMMVKESMGNEAILAETIARKIYANLNVELSPINLLFLILNIGFYNQNTIPQDTMGIILCHGHSTATSIADAVNTLLETHIFEAIDMPLDVRPEEIAGRINTFIKDNDYLRSLVLLVDMGSLERLDELIENRIDIGIMNNITTSLALHSGNMIIENIPLEELLKNASAQAVCSHRLIRAAHKDKVVLFASDTGITVSARLAQLFRRSLPKKINLHMVEYDYLKLEQNKENDPIFEKFDVVLLVSSMNMHIPKIRTVSLEDIISFENIDLLNTVLMEYLNEEDIRSFNKALLDNFSLQSVVEHLTILNAERLLSCVSDAIDRLQVLMNCRFQSKTIIGMNIHVCLLIERLVMKEVVGSFPDIEVFKQEQRMFICQIEEAFERIVREYNVQMPVIEMAYLYNYIANDKKKEELI